QFSPRETEHEYTIEHYNDKFYIVTNWKAMNFRLMETPENATTKQNWKEVIPHRKDVMVSGIDVFADHLVISERRDGLRQIRVIDQRNGNEHYLDFGEAVYSAYPSVNPSFNTNVLRYQFSSLITPRSTFDYDMDMKVSTLLKQSEVVGGHDPADYHSERLYAKVRDGKKVPISIVYKKGFKKNGQGNLLLYAYGSYGSTNDPSFSSTRLSLLDRGFAYAIAHIRGSQTYGRPWYEDGKMFHKMNTFTDFVDCSKYLIQNNYTDPGHLFAMGGSAGGLLMGAVVNLAPELYRGVIAAVPFVDVINTMLDASIPLTSNEWDEWGNPRKKDEYEYMMTYSPYDNVYNAAYPNMLVTAGYFDSQVQYWEPVKWVAKLRDYKVGENVLYLHTNMDAGHGGKSGRFRRYKELSLKYAFMLDLAGMKY
nr:prolyl oligopeptidase family serine peptidase [Candidatus Neomarinimicrobiota bacterium]